LEVLCSAGRGALVAVLVVVCHVGGGEGVRSRRGARSGLANVEGCLPTTGRILWIARIRGSFLVFEVVFACRCPLGNVASRHLEVVQALVSDWLGQTDQVDFLAGLSGTFVKRIRESLKGKAPFLKLTSRLFISIHIYTAFHLYKKLMPMPKLTPFLASSPFL
jgi:hypothetical protein